MKNGYRVIDSDAHIQDELCSWVDYVEPAFRDRRPRIEISDDLKLGWGKRYAKLLPCELFPEPREASSGLGRQGRSGRQLASPQEFMPTKYGQACLDEWSAESRLTDMDTYGWDKQVMITGIGGLGWSWSRAENRDQSLLWALSRAWHNWCHDFASANPKRLYPVVEIPRQHDVDGMITETRRVVSQLGAVTAMMPGSSKTRPWEDPAYEPFWALAEELDFPVSFHGTNSGEPQTAARYQPRDSVPGQQTALEHACRFPFENMLSLAHMIYMGILNKHANLRVVFMEGNAGWLPWWLSRLDDHAIETRRQGMWFDAPLLPLTPTEYFRRQGFVACDGDEGALHGATSLGWEDHIVWNTDYPHPDAPDPDKALDSFLSQPISEDAKRKILWDNAARLFGPRITD